jgi:hypothetical protein
MAALIEVAESFVEILSEAKVSVGELDFVVQAMRSWLKKGYPTFQSQVERAFVARIDSSAQSKRLAKKFFRVNKLLLAELVLSEREIK